jgi:hypothetical protein
MGIERGIRKILYGEGCGMGVAASMINGGSCGGEVFGAVARDNSFHWHWRRRWALDQVGMGGPKPALHTPRRRRRGWEEPSKCFITLKM